MSRRRFLKTSALFGAGAITGGLGLSAARAQSGATDGPTPIRMGGYGPATTSFSQALKQIGDRLAARFGEEVDVRYVYSVTDVGYGPRDLAWLVDSGVLTLGYLQMSAGIPELELAALPFLFQDTTAARAAMDGPLGQAAIERIESQTNYRVLGYFENGFRHVSNNVRPVHAPADLKGLSIRVLPVQARTFELLGATPRSAPLAAVFEGLESGELDGQENPFENIVTYNLYRKQRFYTATYHSYLSRPIFVHGPSFEAWPENLQREMRAAVRDAVILQRRLHDEAEIDSAAIIREAGGEIVELTPDQRRAFIEAVAPVHAEARNRYSRSLLDLANL